jgi:integrase
MIEAAEWRRSWNRTRGRPSPERKGAQARLCRRLHIARFTNHQIRHSCATQLLRQGVDHLVIAKHLGHHGLRSIQGYAEVGLDTRHQMLEVLDGILAAVAG